MKALELIEELERALEERGDVEVVTLGQNQEYLSIVNVSPNGDDAPIVIVSQVD